jgi:UDP-N-acetylglucosamine 2-epimerase (non-hydrolysing)
MATKNIERTRIMAVFGTRPEAIKMAPVVKALQKESHFETTVCVTAQHREMLDQVLELFSIKPDYDLNIMQEKQSLSEVTCRVLKGMDQLLKEYKPHMILVHGDTTTTFAASLAAFYHKVKIGHVEAGLRTHNRYFPFPEEMNRRLAGSLANLHFAPTKRAKLNLLNEGVLEENIFITGNTVIDAMAYTIAENYLFKNEELQKIDYDNKKVLLVTAHRRENWGEGLENICKALRALVDNYPDIELVYLVHLNPMVLNTVKKNLHGLDRVHLLPPLDIRETHNLISKSYLVMTDSGGIQEEAPHLGKPVLVFRKETERPEAVQVGTVKLVGTDYQSIVNTARELLIDPTAYDNMSKAINPYGDGKASIRIVKILQYYFKKTHMYPEEFDGPNEPVNE